MKGFSHLDDQGEVRMVDISAKPAILREAVACGEIRLLPATIEAIEGHQIAKGNVLATARIAGIQAAKRTGDLIPLCHPLALSDCEVQFSVPESRDRILISARVKTVAPTGVEMEALTAVSLAALTIYDMCKALDSSMLISEVRLVSKRKGPV